MRYKVVWLEGGKKIKCAYHHCVRTKQGIVWQPCFTESEARLNDVLNFCQRTCYDEHYKTHPITVPKKKLKDDLVFPIPIGVT